MRAVLSTSGEPKAVLVTGGAGFIGSHLVRRLLSYEYRVRVLDNFATGNERNLAGLEELEVVTGDIRSRVDVAEAMQGMNAVFHLAALPAVARSWKDLRRCPPSIPPPSPRTYRPTYLTPRQAQSQLHSRRHRSRPHRPGPRTRSFRPRHQHRLWREPFLTRTRRRHLQVARASP